MSTDTHPAAEAAEPPHATNGVARSGRPPSDEELAREIIEFEMGFPPPDLNEIRADARWFDEHLDKPELAQYCGSFVAVLDGAVIGHGPNALLLQLEAAKRLNVHPQRFILEYVPRPTF